MGLWNKMKGVFGRINAGAKKAYNWVKNHLNTIKEVSDKAADFIPEQYKGGYDAARGKAFDTFDKMRNVLG